ncbi:TTL10 polyglycylase, partial [Amia calva]|nr:TTL10 polyglycylase [Amia calva]
MHSQAFTDLSFEPRRQSRSTSLHRDFCPSGLKDEQCNLAVLGRVSLYCERKGWQRLHDKRREDYRLKWCETKSCATYSSFREGEQLLYQIPNNKVLTTKIGLLTSLREYERVTNKVKQGRGHSTGCPVLIMRFPHRCLTMEEFFPETFRMDLREEREAFFAQYEEGQVWICKPTGLNQGRGIFLLRSGDDVVTFRNRLQGGEDSQQGRKTAYRSPQARIAQRYIQNPLLLEGKKFDIRSYFLIASTTPYMVFFRHGYVRVTCDPYDPNSADLSAHLTNQYMQKKHPLYNELKEETVWSMERFNCYVNETFAAARALPRDWVCTVFAKRMQQIMTQCFLAVKSKLECRLGYFDLIGCDFMIDEDFKASMRVAMDHQLHLRCLESIILMLIYLLQGILPLSGMSVHAITQDNAATDMFEISGPMVDSKIVICANPAELRTWLDNIQERIGRATSQQLCPFNSILSFLVPCDEKWKKEELKRYLLRTPIWNWEGKPIQHLGPVGYLSLVHISGAQRTGSKERLLVIFPQDLLLLSIDSQRVQVRYEVQTHTSA